MTMTERNQDAKSSLAAIYCNNQLDVTGAFCCNFSYDFLLWKNANEGISGECLYWRTYLVTDSNEKICNKSTRSLSQKEKITQEIAAKKMASENGPIDI